MKNDKPTPTPPQEGIGHRTIKGVTKNQIITIQTILSQKGLRDEKESIVTGVSGGRTCHVSELYFEEAAKLINFLAASSRPTTPSSGGEGNENDKRQKMQRHIIAMGHEIGFVKKQNIVMREGGIREINNYDDLHAWILKFGYLHKPMNKYNYQELPKLVTQMKAMYASKMKIK